MLYKLLNQTPNERYSLMAQALMLDIALHLQDGETLSIENLKAHAKEAAAKMTNDKDFDKVRDQVKALSLMEAKR